jgi:DNA-binding NarL/FixJ family response regulator
LQSDQHARHQSSTDQAAHRTAQQQAQHGDGDDDRARRALVLDDVALVRHGVRAVLEPLAFEVADTHSARDAAAIVSAQPFDVAIVGWPADDDTAVAVRRLKALASPPAVVVLVPPRHHDGVLTLLQAGAEVLVPRSVDPDELAEAVGAALVGAGFVAPVLQRTLMGSVAPCADGTNGDDDAALSAREREVLTFLAAGRSNREIASALSLSVATVKTHLGHVYAKLGVRDRAAAVQAAVALGMLQ